MIRAFCIVFLACLSSIGGASIITVSGTHDRIDLRDMPGVKHVVVENSAVVQTLWVGSLESVTVEGGVLGGVGFGLGSKPGLLTVNGGSIERIYWHGDVVMNRGSVGVVNNGPAASGGVFDLRGGTVDGMFWGGGYQQTGGLVSEKLTICCGGGGELRGGEISNLDVIDGASFSIAGGRLTGVAGAGFSNGIERLEVRGGEVTGTFDIRSASVVLHAVEVTVNDRALPFRYAVEEEIVLSEGLRVLATLPDGNVVDIDVDGPDAAPPEPGQDSFDWREFFGPYASSLSVVWVPEPGCFSLVASGATVLMYRRRRVAGGGAD